MKKKQSKVQVTGRITSPKPSIDFRSVKHGSISDSGINIGKANKSGTTSPFVPIPKATCSITDGFLETFFIPVVWALGKPNGVLEVVVVVVVVVEGLFGWKNGMYGVMNTKNIS